MKQLTCEMCRSTDIMKDGGVFVCQTCGCKYSLEEARKMMVEGTVEVQGVVQVANTAQISNLMNMAKNAFDSKNYAKAEEFCDQIIAMDDKHYDAWMLKGRAINYQINAKNPRILEVYNCIMTCYRILDKDMDESEMLLKKLEIARALKECIEGEVDFWLDQFEAGRPTNAALKKVKSTYVSCYNMMKEAYEEMDVDSTVYLKNFDNHFCWKANSICVSAWQTTVAYNYFRKDLNNLGKNWNRSLNRTENGTDYFRPGEKIWRTFLEETDNLIILLEYCIDQFNDTTPLQCQENIYSNIAFYESVAKDQVSYKPMVSTTTNGYGAVVSRREYYDIDYYLTDSAKANRQNRARRYEAKEEEIKQRRRQQEREEKEQRFKQYWEEHAEEKAALESEQQELTNQIAAQEKERDAIPTNLGLSNLEGRIEAMALSKKSLGLFEIKKKQEMQKQIDALNTELEALKVKIHYAQKPFTEEIQKLEKRVRSIQDELTKER